MTEHIADGGQKHAGQKIRKVKRKKRAPRQADYLCEEITQCRPGDYAYISVHQKSARKQIAITIPKATPHPIFIIRKFPLLNS